MADATSPLNQFQLWRAMLPPALGALLTINAVTYVVYVVLSIASQGELMRWLALPGDLAGLAAQPWAALTWGVTNIQPGFFGLIVFGFGLAWLSLLGRDIEQEGGAHRLVGVYVLGTLGGTLLAMAATGFRMGAPAAGGMGVYAGIWGPLLALLCYTAVLHPDRPIGLMFIGAVALKWIAIVIVVLELAFQKDPSHLGAALVGALVGLAEKRGTDLTGWLRPLFRGRRATSPGGSSGRSSSRTAGRASTSRPTDIRRETPMEQRAARPPRPAASDVDAVLDKISAQGIDSLTPDERRILDRAGRG